MTKTMLRTEAPPRRSSGRPGPGASAVGRQALIETTCDILKTVPPHGITMAMVAAAAGVAPSLLKYYFRDRATLMAAATENLMQKARGLADDLAEPRTAEAELRTRIHGLLDLETQYPFMHRMIIDEVVNGQSPSALDQRKMMTERAVGNYTAILASLAQRPLGRNEPLFLYMSILGMCGFFVSGAGILRETLGDDYDKAALAEDYVQYMTDLILNGLPRASMNEAPSSLPESADADT